MWTSAQKLDLEPQNYEIPEPLAREKDLFIKTSRVKLERAIRAAMVFFGLLSLLVPIIALYFVRGKTSRLAIVCAATSIFAVAVALGTTAKNEQVLASMAA
jgi:hypothetical protein